MANTVYELPELITRLAKEERQLFDRIFSVDAAQAKMNIPPSMHAYCEKFFGSVEAVLHQRPVKVTNRITLETSIFNALRSKRPQSYNNSALEEVIESERRSDPFANPLQGTSTDIFDRVYGEFCVTASNIAKFDTWHSVVVFNEYHPLKFGPQEIIDYLMTARAWAENVQEQDEQARYFFFMWNSLFRAGASLMHGHAQMTVTRQQHYGRVERLRRDNLEYNRQYRRSFFNDLVQAHRVLGLTVTPAERVIAFATLTPLAEREIWLVSDLWSPELGLALYHALGYFKSAGACAFNVGAYVPPIGPTPGREDWGDFPVILRLVDRGDPQARSSDIGALNLFAATPVINDPFEVARGFQKYLQSASVKA
ncbi:MAG: hypothetical protein JWP00_1029 [Chloroflexi bacterium]|nr:hypothetical protein [Chloroflexota bacterium]